MESRRSFLKKALLTAISLFLLNKCSTVKKKVKMKSKDPKLALVTWFSQTGHTERIGKIIAHKFEQSGIKVISGDVRGIDKKSLENYELIVMGSPVYYYEMPVFLKDWIKGISKIEGVPVFSYTTFGGTGHNQHNTACDILELLSDKGGLPVGSQTFGNMSTFAPTWSTGRIERILKYKHLPNKKTFNKAGSFASKMLENIKKERVIKIDHEFSIFNILEVLGTAWWTKKVLLKKHSIDKNKCIKCGLCVRKCPGNAIDLAKYSVSNSKCQVCFGCVNLCPENAHDMVFMGDRVYGFKEFLKKYKIKIQEPGELGNKT
ncbi:EFR1 family ferrodoxin [Spirochaetota bacterium]